MSEGFIKYVIDMIYPEKSKCLYCGSLSEINAAGLCSSCMEMLPYITERLCLRCGRPMPPVETGALCSMCRKGAVHFDSGCVVFHFTGIIQNVIYRLKYGGERDMALIIGKLMAERLEDTGWDIDMMIPVPLHVSRYKERGFNQSFLLASVMGRELEINVSQNILIRKRDTGSQTQLTGSYRVHNVKDAFSVKDCASLKGSSVLVVDDIMTTGATLNECSRELKKYGAGKVFCIAAACPMFND